MLIFTWVQGLVLQKPEAGSGGKAQNHRMKGTEYWEHNCCLHFYPGPILAQLSLPRDSSFGGCRQQVALLTEVKYISEQLLSLLDSPGGKATACNCAFLGQAALRRRYQNLQWGVSIGLWACRVVRASLIYSFIQLSICNIPLKLPLFRDLC